MVEKLDKSKWKNKSIGWSIGQVFKVRQRWFYRLLFHLSLSKAKEQASDIFSIHSLKGSSHGCIQWQTHTWHLLNHCSALLRYLISSFCLCSLLIIVEIQDWTADEIYFRYCHISWYFLQPGKYQLWCRWYRLKFWISVWRFPVILANSNSGAADTDWNEVMAAARETINRQRQRPAKKWISC